MKIYLMIRVWYLRKRNEMLDKKIGKLLMQNYELRKGLEDGDR